MRRSAAVLTALALVLAACGDDADTGSPSDATTTSSTTTTTMAPPTTTTVSPDCSAAGIEPTVPVQPALPPVVAAMRLDLAAAAATCDWDELRELADRNGQGVNVSFGAPADPIAHLQEAEERGGDDAPMRALRLLLELPVATQDLGGGDLQYVWPRAHTDANFSEEALQEVADTGLYTRQQLEDMRRAGAGYLGYRVLITAAGDWTAFVAGD
jgi:hypothetical protein